MSYFGPSACGLFASRNLGAHLIRGGIAALLIGWALLHQSSNPVFAAGAGAVSLVVMRGCPACWMVGLVETVAQLWRRI